MAKAEAQRGKSKQTLQPTAVSTFVNMLLIQASNMSKPKSRYGFFLLVGRTKMTQDKGPGHRAG